MVIKWNEILNSLPQPAQVIIVLLSILALGASAGKAASDLTVQEPLLVELQELRKVQSEIRQLEEQSLCIQVSQLRKTDWTYCLVSPDGNY